MNELEIRLVYYIQQERQDNEMVEKIVWNDIITEEICRLINQESQVEVIGLYGTQETVKAYLKEKTKCKVKFQDDIKKWENRGILCWTSHNSTFYFSFMALDQYYTKDIFEETSDIIIYRYLKDLCHKIIMLPSKKILNGWNDLRNHFYEEQIARVQDFQIQRIQDTELVIKPLKVSSEDRFRVPIQNFAHGADDIRCLQLESTSQEQIIMPESEMNLLFLEILNNKQKKINLDDQYSIKIIREINNLRQQFTSKIQQEFATLSQSFHSNISKQGFILKNTLKDNKLLFDNIHQVLFNMFREMLDLDKINLLDTRLIKEKTVSLMIEEQYKNFLQNNQKDLEKLISEYNMEFQKFYKNKIFPIHQIAAQFRQELKLKLKFLSNESDLFIDVQLFEFRYIISKDNNQDPQCIIEHLNTKKLYISKFIKQEKEQIIKIQYYCLQANQKQNMLVLSNQTNKQTLQYFWINCQLNKSILIISLNPSSSKPLLFYYDTQDTSMYVFNSKIGITIFQYNEDREQLKSERNINYNSDDIFIDVCYLKYYECFILLSKLQNLLKWSIDSKEIHSFKLEPKFNNKQNEKLNYQKIISTGIGNYYILANYEKCDIYSFNNELVLQILFSKYDMKKLGMNQILLYSNSQDWFIYLIDDKKQICLQIQNISSQQQIIAKNKRNQLQKSNPYFDLIKGSVIKYGPTINFFDSSWIQTQHYINQQAYQKLKNYFNIIEFNQTDELVESQNIIDIQGCNIQTKQIIFYLISRISIQLCTIEKSLLIPLCNGLQLKLGEQKQNKIRILQKIEQIQFGILERLLSYKNQNIFIISIMGRQSSGKSYLLNRIFGTRFGVSSARCTDGIWLGVSLIKDTIFILFDCEGLFSSRRTSDEETLLLSFLSSISDITILNQDLSFNRNLNQLFNNLSQSMEQVRGEKLFRGQLMIAVRDVNQKEQVAAYAELMKNIEIIKNNQQTGSFLAKLFNNEFSIIMMSYFDTNSFDKDIKVLRNKFLDQSKNQQRWDNYNQLLRSMKIMLVQLEVQDHRSLEDHELEYSVKVLERKASDLWYFMKQQNIEFMVFDDPQNTFINLIQYLEKKLGRSQSTLSHNKFLNDYNIKLQDLLNIRKNLVINLIENESITQNMIINKEKISRVKQEIKQYLDDQSVFYQICLEKCGQCFLLCKERKNHINMEILKNKENLELHLEQISQEILDLNKNIKSKDSIEIMNGKTEENRIKYQQLDEMEQYLMNQQTLMNETQKMKKFFNQESFNLKDFDSYLIKYVITQQISMNSQNFEEQFRQFPQNQQILKQVDNKEEEFDQIEEDDNDISSEHLDQSDKLFNDTKTPYSFKTKKQQQPRGGKQIIEDYVKDLKLKIEILQQKQMDLSNNILLNAQVENKKQMCQNQIKHLEKQYQNYHYITNFYQDVLKLQNYLKDQHIKYAEQNINLEQLQNQRKSYQIEIKFLEEQINLINQINDLKISKANKQNEINSIKESLIQQHNCGRKFHQCDQICEGCQKPGTYCKQLAGHAIDNKYHLCNQEQHFCKKICNTNNCQSLCQHRLDHSEDLQHDCLEKHQCLEQCKFCSNGCEENARLKHMIHQCKVKECQKECFFCTNYSNPEKKCTNNCSYKHNEIHPNHVCKKPHNCNKKCERLGICQIASYTEEMKEWTTQNGTKFPYKVFKQNTETLNCFQQIKMGLILHDGQHSCNEKNHTCDKRCPECESICTQQYGHKGNHKPHLHRNKECQIFTQLEGTMDQNLIIEQQGELNREFQILESCEPETCTRSCTRRSRAHIHLLKCEGGENCAQIKLNKNGRKAAKHQNTKYKGSDSIYDEILCEYYWDYLGWDSPAESKDRIEISLCNYYCSVCGEKDKKYCTQEAWHTDSINYSDHNFSCNSQHKNINGVDVQFVIDTTGSMQSYIEMVKETVKRLITATQPFIKNNPDGILFSVVSYKDHCDPKVVESINFCKHNKALTFLDSLKANGGGDYPEAMLDGLNEGSQQSWRNQSNKLLFLIADSPPHGKPQFHNSDDDHPSGCPCNLNENTVLHKLQKQNIEMVILKLNQNLNQTIAVFKKIWSNIVALEKISNEEFMKKIEQLVCKQLEIKEITLRKG